MPIGSRRHLVTLEETNGNDGHIPLDPPDWYCAVLNESSGLATFAGHFHPGITTATRVTFKGRIYAVKNVSNPRERDEELVLDCEQVFD
jgi:hypothetical protein